MSWNAMPRAMPVMSSAAASANSGPSSRSIWVLSHRSRRVCTASRDAPVSCSSAITRMRGRSTSSPAISLPTGAPVQRSVPSKTARTRVGRLRDAGARARSRPRARFARRRAAPWPRSRSGSVGGERETVEPADDMALDHHLAGLLDFSFQCRVLAQPPHQYAGAAIDETLGEPLVQRIRELVLDAARDALPVFRIGKPVGTVRHEGPGPHMRDPVRQRIDVAVGPVGLGHLGENQSVGNSTLSHQKSIEGRNQLGMRWPARSCGSREPGRRPTTARRRGGAPCADLRVARGVSSTRMSSAIGARVSPARPAPSTTSEACSARSSRSRDPSCAIAGP
jgi:hypothetical protein